MDQKKKSLPDMDKWTLELMVNCPRQTNGDDCGVFLCAFLEYMMIGRDLTFSQADIKSVHEQTALCILKLQSD